MTPWGTHFDEVVDRCKLVSDRLAAYNQLCEELKLYGITVDKKAIVMDKQKYLNYVWEPEDRAASENAG